MHEFFKKEPDFDFIFSTGVLFVSKSSKLIQSTTPFLAKFLFIDEFIISYFYELFNRFAYSLFPSTQFLRADGVLFQYAEKEAIYYHINDSDADLAAVLDEYFEYYNEVRMHRTLKMKTLSQVETEFFERVNL